MFLASNVAISSLTPRLARKLKKNTKTAKFKLGGGAYKIDVELFYMSAKLNKLNREKQHYLACGICTAVLRLYTYKQLPLYIITRVFII